MRHIHWHIGCSGFHYKEWKEVFYPKGLPQTRWFDFYAQHFNTLELNVTFYRFPTLKSLQTWHDKAPAGFTFSAKVPRTITHYKKFADTETTMIEFYAVLAEGLAEKLRCVLFQLPPSFTYSEERLQNVLAHANPAFQNVIEFRHESWWREDVKALLGKNNIAFCGVSFPKIQFDDAVINTPTPYYRFHGVPKLFYSEYDENFLQKIHWQISASPKAKEAFVYFNNTASLAALHNARYFRQLTGNKTKNTDA
jgi:uncharacterized protein YecE (DUF72 family)